MCPVSRLGAGQLHAKLLQLAPQLENLIGSNPHPLGWAVVRLSLAVRAPPASGRYRVAAALRSSTVKPSAGNRAIAIL